MIEVLIPTDSEFQKYDDELKSLYQENQKIRLVKQNMRRIQQGCAFLE